MNYCFTVLKNEGKDKKEDEDWNGGVVEWWSDGVMV